MDTEHASGPSSADPPGFLNRIRVAIGLLAGLRRHDLRAARSFFGRMYPSHSGPARLLKFAEWTMWQMFGTIPSALTTASFSRPVSRTSLWLSADNPLANHPWSTDPNARLPEEAEVAVIGAGFTGAACAYHWSKQDGGTMAVLEMNEAASGASGRNEGLVVMGRYYANVKDTVLQHLHRIRTDLSPQQRDRLASMFAAAYVRSAYKNADLIAQTIEDEGFDCDYAREGCVQARDAEEQPALEESVRLGREAGFDDWSKIEPEEALRLGGMRVDHPSGFSSGAASWHPARWVWSLLTTALKAEHVSLFCRTRVMRVVDQGDHYAVHTDRGTVRARSVVNATESYSALLHPQLRNRLHVVQSQAAFAEGGPKAMKPHIGLQFTRGFFGRLADGVVLGSDA